MAVAGISQNEAFEGKIASTPRPALPAFPRRSDAHALPAEAMGKGWFQKPLLAKASHQLLCTEPSGATQKTSSWFASRATAATGEPGWALPAGAIGKGWFQRPLLAKASHQLLRTEPSDIRKEHF